MHCQCIKYHIFAKYGQRRSRLFVHVLFLLRGVPVIGPLMTFLLLFCKLGISPVDYTSSPLDVSAADRQDALRSNFSQAATSSAVPKCFHMDTCSALRDPLPLLSALDLVLSNNAWGASYHLCLQHVLDSHVQLYLYAAVLAACAQSCADQPQC